MSSWEDLAQLRAEGYRPQRLCVTTDFRRCRTQAEAGAMVIVHRPGEKLPVGLLEKLHVELHLQDCSQTFRLAKALKARCVEPADCSAWCECEQRIVIFVSPNCAHAAQCARDWEG